MSPPPRRTRRAAARMQVPVYPVGHPMNPIVTKTPAGQVQRARLGDEPFPAWAPIIRETQ